VIVRDGIHRCPDCRNVLRADVFNAFHTAPASGAAGETVRQQGQAECYYHPGKQAVIPCSACGRLLCCLCEIELDGRILCMGCIESGRSNQKIRSLENHRILYSNIALALAVYPALLIFPTLFTGPAAIYVALRYWKAPGSIVKRMRWRSVLAILFGAGQVAAWAFFFIGMIAS
jgi:hypothetical protein